MVPVPPEPREQYWVPAMPPRERALLGDLGSEGRKPCCFLALSFHPAGAEHQDPGLAVRAFLSGRVRQGQELTARSPLTCWRQSQLGQLLKIRSIVEIKLRLKV